MPNRPYDSAQWPTLRQRILERDCYRCQIQLAGCTTQADRVDHIIGWKQGGAWYADTNLQAACRSCNTAKRYAGESTPPTPVVSRTW